MSLDHDAPNRSRRTVFAAGGVLLLLGVAFAAAMWAGSDPASEPTQSTQADGLAALAAPLSLDMPHAPIAVPDQAMQGAWDLPAGGILAGQGFALADAGGYAIGQHEAAIQGAAGAGFLWQSMPSNASIQGPSLRTDTEADRAIAEAESALAQVAALWAGGDVQGLLDAADDAGAEHGVAVPGLVRSPLGAGQAVEPDDAAATDAQLHADAMLAVVDGGYGDLAAGLDRIHQIQSGLPAQLQAAYHGVDAFGAQAQSSLDAQHEARIDAITAQAQGYEAAVQAAARAHAGAAVAARDAGLGDVEASLAAQQLALEEAVGEARRDVDARMQAVHDAADGRLAELERMEAEVAADATTSAGAQDALDAMADVRATIEAQRSAALQAAADAHAGIDAQEALAQARLQDRAADARQNVTQAADEAIAWAAEREAGLLAGIQGAVEAGLELESQTHAAASARVAALVDGRKQLLQEQALETVAQARQEATRVQRVVEAVQEDADAEVSHDLEVILAVADDHRSVPTAQREAAADAWMEVHGLLRASLDQAIGDGVDVLVKAQAVLDAAAQAEAAIA